MTVAIADTRDTTLVDEAVPPVVASWASRAGAMAVDAVPAAVVVVTTVLVAVSVPLYSGWWWTSVSVASATLLLTALNRVLLPQRWQGTSLGRAVFGIAVLRRDGSSPGPWRLLLRDLAHLADTVPMLVGWLWPLWDARGRTIADMVMRTESLRVERSSAKRSARRVATAMAVIAAGLSALGAVISYSVVYQRDQSSAHARSEIEADGPRMVEEVLSYRPQSIQADFSHALSLVTDNYRGQLIAQQQTVQKAGIAPNEYWVTNSSVITAQRDRTAMLLFLQGRRGAAPNQRYITASVRANFVKSDGKWLIDFLAVITKVQPTESKP